MHTKKVFVVKNFKSPYIEQAIFILREEAQDESAYFNAVRDAERVVNDYLAGNKAPITQKKKKRLSLSPRFVFCFCGIILLGFFLRSIF